jgi:hypothetical protein
LRSTLGSTNNIVDCTGPRILCRVQLPFAAGYHIPWISNDSTEKPSWRYEGLKNVVVGHSTGPLRWIESLDKSDVTTIARYSCSAAVFLSAGSKIEGVIDTVLNTYSSTNLCGVRYSNVVLFTCHILLRLATMQPCFCTLNKMGSFTIPASYSIRHSSNTASLSWETSPFSQHVTAAKSLLICIVCSAVADSPGRKFLVHMICDNFSQFKFVIESGRARR